MSNAIIDFTVGGFAIDTRQDKAQLLPAHDFRAKDGRPNDAPVWKINSQIAGKLIRELNQRQNKTVIDYEHQTLTTAETGEPAPAAGWFQGAEWIEGLGLFATQVEWTQRAQQLINARKRRYLSPVFSYEPQTGEIISILHAALTNNPAIVGMQEIAALTTAKQHHSSPLTTEQLAVYRMLGISKEQLAATRIKTTPHHCGLSNQELDICHRLNISPADYVAAR